MPYPGQMPPRSPSSAVITVSYGSSEVLEDFLRTLREFHGPAQTVVVVDNNPSEEGSQTVARRYGASYVPLPSNPGYGAGMNVGVHSLTETFDTYFFCNPDVSFTEPTIAQLATSLMEQPEAGSIGPKILNDDGGVYPSARSIPSISTGVGHGLFSKTWPQNPWTRSYQDSENYSDRRPAGSLSGAAVMVKHEALNAINGWDESYFMHFEDIDLGFRLGLAGYTNVFDPAVSLHHSGAHSTKKHAAVVERAMTESAVRFMGKRYPGFWNAPLRLVITAGLRVRGQLKLRRLTRDV